MSLNIPVILGSIRQGRKSESPALWLAEKIRALGHDSSVVDFKLLPLPLLDCELEPVQYHKQYPNENVQTWSGIADAADGFVFVIPEYNHGIPAVLKNALDWLYFEFQYKPVGLVGVSSGRFSGARAVEQVRELCGNFGMYDIKETVMIGPVKEVFDEQGKLINEKYHKSADGMIAAIIKSASALKTLRDA